MPITEKMFDNSTLGALSRQAAPRVLNAIKTAAAKTGVDFAYLMEKAAAESGFNAKASSKTSSATGLFQFIESTWLKMVKSHGAKYGLGRYAEKISADGRVADPHLKKEILDLRKDPEKSSLLAAEFAAENKNYLQQHLGPDAAVGPVEMYLAHFMGAGAATAFLKEKQDNPLQTAADLFPRAARANRNVFYDRETGQPRTLAGIYDFFAKKFGASGVSGPAMAQVVPAMPETTAADDASGDAAATMLRQQMAMDNALLETFSAPDRSRADEQNASIPLPFSVSRPTVPARTPVSFNAMQLQILARLEPPKSFSYRLNN